jgi:hypothetical protein
MSVVPQRNTRGAWVVGGNAAAGEHGFGREDRGVVVYPVRDENRRLNLVHDQVDWVAAHRGRLESPLRHDQTPTPSTQPPVEDVHRRRMRRPEVFNQWVA